MKKMSKFIYLCLCLALFLIPAGCGSAELASATVTNIPETTITFDISNAIDMLDKIIASENKPEPVPDLIWGAKLVRQGCELSIDWLDYHDRPGNMNEKDVRNKVEQVDTITVSGTYLSSRAISSQYLGQDFVDYIASQKDGAKFTFYMLDGQVLFVKDLE